MPRDRSVPDRSGEIAKVAGGKSTAVGAGDGGDLPRGAESARLWRRIETLPGGSFSFTTWLDDDCSGSNPLSLVATVSPRGDTLHVDFEGSGSQARGALSAPRNALRSTVYYCIKALLDRERMANSGMFEPLVISAPKGSIANPNFPAACGASSITCQTLGGAVFGAFREILPIDRLVASSNDLFPTISFSVAKSNGGLHYYGETIGGGRGA